MSRAAKLFRARMLAMDPPTRLGAFWIVLRYRFSGWPRPDMEQFIAALFVVFYPVICPVMVVVTFFRAIISTPEALEALSITREKEGK